MRRLLTCALAGTTLACGFIWGCSDDEPSEGIGGRGGSAGRDGTAGRGGSDGGTGGGVMGGRGGVSGGGAGGSSSGAPDASIESDGGYDGDARVPTEDADVQRIG